MGEKLGLEVKGTLLEVFRSKGIGPAVSADLDPQTGLIKYMDMVQHEFVFAIYSLASQPIVDAIKRMKDRGVSIRGLGDSKQWSGMHAMNQQLVDYGIDFERAVKQFRCMHLKVGVGDGAIVALGSFNYTANAEAHNDEVLLISESTELAKVMIDQIDSARAENKAIVRQQIEALGNAGT